MLASPQRPLYSGYLDLSLFAALPDWGRDGGLFRRMLEVSWIEGPRVGTAEPVRAEPVEVAK